MRLIVVGYDGTETAAKAAREAVTLANATGAELHILTVVNDDRLRHGMTTSETHERERRQALASTKELVSDPDWILGQQATDIAVTVETATGSPADKLVEYANDVNADLIVVGNRRVQGIERVLGSVAIAVLRQAQCSVYVAYST